jgi:hypothetical protein
MGRGLGETQRLLLGYFEDNPQCLISTEVLLWWQYDDNENYMASLAAFNNLSGETVLPWDRYEAINLRRSLHSLERKGLVKCWGRPRMIRLLNGGVYDNPRCENFWSAPSCEGAKSSKFVLAYKVQRRTPIDRCLDKLVTLAIDAGVIREQLLDEVGAAYDELSTSSN